MRMMRIFSGNRDTQGSRWLAACTVLLAVALLAGCATSRAVRSADSAARQGDWDTAVTFYREALGREPDRADLRIKLERATRLASAEHVTRARQLEEQEQLPGAIAEYRMAAELDPSNMLAAQKAAELDRQMRDLVEAARPRAPVEALREQGAQTSSIPRLNPSTVVPEMRFPNASVRDILSTISKLTGINITYDQGLDAALSRPYPIDMQETPLEELLNQILQANSLTFKVQNEGTIFIYQDTPPNRARFESQYIQTFYLSSAVAGELLSQLNQLLQGSQVAVPPRIVSDERANTITARATAPVLEVIDAFIRANDRSLPEVMIEAEILEVDRNFLRNLGLDLNQWAFGLSFSPEVAPSTSAAAPPFNLNTISRGVSAADFYMTSPTALIRLLESDSNTRTLAKPSTRGTAGRPVVLTMGQDVPIPTTVFQSAAAGGVANVPTTSVNYQPVGVNLRFTPLVTYEDEIVLSDLILEKSGLGGTLDVGGQSFPTIVSRKAQSSIRLRDGESTLIAGLLLDEDRRTIRSIPGVSSVPFLRNLLGNSERRIDQTDIVMIITPRIVRGHGLTSEDVRPMYVGTGQNMTTSPTPQLLSPEALGTSPAAAPPSSAPAGPAPASTAEPAGDSPAAPIVPIAPVPDAAPADNQTRVIVSPPTTGPSGALLAGGGPHTMPIQVVGASDLRTLSLTITYDPTVMADPAVTQGSFMGQGGVQSTFVPSVDAAEGRIDLAFSRPTSGPGASGAGLLAAVSFRAGDAGSTDVRVAGVGTTSTGQSVPIQFTAGRVTVR